VIGATAFEFSEFVTNAYNSAGCFHTVVQNVALSYGNSYHPRVTCD